MIRCVRLLLIARLITYVKANIGNYVLGSRGGVGSANN